MRRRGEGIHQGPQRASNGLHGGVAGHQLRGAGVVLDCRVRNMRGRRCGDRVPAVAADRLDVMHNYGLVRNAKGSFNIHIPILYKPHTLDTHTHTHIVHR